VGCGNSVVAGELRVRGWLREGCANVFMQLADTCGGDRQVGRFDAQRGLDRPHRGWPAGRADPALAARAPGGTVLVVMLDVDPKDPLQVATANDQEPVEALGADRPDPALGVGVGVGPWGARSRVPLRAARTWSQAMVRDGCCRPVGGAGGLVIRLSGAAPRP
jgi:hypothetical protein